MSAGNEQIEFTYSDAEKVLRANLRAQSNPDLGDISLINDTEFTASIRIADTTGDSHLSIEFKLIQITSYLNNGSDEQVEITYGVDNNLVRVTNSSPAGQSILDDALLSPENVQETKNRLLGIYVMTAYVLPFLKPEKGTPANIIVKSSSTGKSTIPLDRDDLVHVKIIGDIVKQAVESGAIFEDRHLKELGCITPHDLVGEIRKILENGRTPGNTPGKIDKAEPGKDGQGTDNASRDSGI